MPDTSSATIVPTSSNDKKGDGLPSKGFKDEGSLKLWVVKYVAHKIEVFRVSPEFKQLVEEYRNFAFDLICAVNAGPPLV